MWAADALFLCGSWASCLATEVVLNWIQSTTITAGSGEQEKVEHWRTEECGLCAGNDTSPEVDFQFVYCLRRSRVNCWPPTTTTRSKNIHRLTERRRPCCRSQNMYRSRRTSCRQFVLDVVGGSAANVGVRRMPEFLGVDLSGEYRADACNVTKTLTALL